MGEIVGSVTARPAGRQRNELPDCCAAGSARERASRGTAFEVRFHASPDGLWVEPIQGAVMELPQLRGVVAYPDLRAAAGHAQQTIEPPDAERVLVPVDTVDRDLFAVRVAGTSMDGGKEPLRDGDWAILRVARSAPAHLHPRSAASEPHEPLSG